jgi:hypothetical protein
MQWGSPLLPPPQLPSAIGIPISDPKSKESNLMK